MKQPYSVEPKAGQTALLWNNGKVMIKKSYSNDSRIYTTWESFVGTMEEVEAKIKELGLKDLPLSNTQKAPSGYSEQTKSMF
jgi:hypothetical protein